MFSINPDDLAAERDFIVNEPDAVPRILFAIKKYLEWLLLLEVQRGQRVYIHRRIALSSGGFQLVDFGMESDYWQIFIEKVTPETFVEIHYGEFLGVLPKLTLPSGRWAQVPATGQKILLRNSGTSTANIALALTNRGTVVL